ncbi:Aste57867_12751 [Aphanomyces stellatus]|uniref:Aste57867_12751 protein n=1 Tax=Aphanomyces stellatus TaxID=120398 RepID=A0A485KWT9_9STRA|nr:hypothetical protein As57867_012703 [Aphanomyces stellatus]VFT89600.1 Aste57867_12751 [Aphanomyces stellatus]
MQVDCYVIDTPMPTYTTATTAATSPSDAELHFLVHQVNQLPSEALEEMIYIVSAYEPQWLDVFAHNADSDFDVSTLSPLAIEVMQQYVYTHLACCFVTNMIGDDEDSTDMEG